MTPEAKEVASDIYTYTQNNGRLDSENEITQTLEQYAEGKVAEVIIKLKEEIELREHVEIALDEACRYNQDMAKERDAFQTQAGARKKECFELKAHVLLLVEALKPFIADTEHHLPAKSNPSVCNICDEPTGRFDEVRSVKWPCNIQKAKEALSVPPIQKQVRVSEAREKVVEVAIKMMGELGPGKFISGTGLEMEKAIEALRILREEEGK